MDKRNNPTGHIPGLDGLRAVAATMVFVFHAWGQSGYPNIVVDVFGHDFSLGPALQFGAKGVALFFALSGFLLSQPFWRALIRHGPAVNLRHYLTRRLLRIYPAYLIAVLLFALVYDIAHPVSSRIIMVVTHLLLIHNFAEVTVYNLSVPLWSVATEFQLYLLLPVIFWLLRVLKGKGVRDWCSAPATYIIAGIIGASAWPALNALVQKVQFDPRLVVAGGKVLPSLPIFGLAHFAAGIMAAFVYVKLREHIPSQRIIHGRVVEILAALSLLALVLVTLFAPTLGIPPSGWPGLSLVFASLIIWVSLGGKKGGVTWFLELAPVRWVGLISYSFYLYHDFVLYNVYHHLPLNLLGSWANSHLVKGLLAYIITLIVAAASYALIERRLTDWLKHVLGSLRQYSKSLVAEVNA